MTTDDNSSNNNNMNNKRNGLGRQKRQRQPAEYRVLYNTDQEPLRFHGSVQGYDSTDSTAHDMFHQRHRRYPLVFGYYFGSVVIGRTTTTSTITANGDATTTTMTTAVKKGIRFIGAAPLYPYLSRPLTRNSVPMTATEMKAQMALEHSDDYDDNRRDDLETRDCALMHDWQKTTFPTCNIVHETALTELSVRADTRRQYYSVRMLGGGYWRDVWMVRDSPWKLQYALKTMRYKHNVNDRNFDRHRRDAVAMERLTSAENIVDIYGFCGNSGIFEYASGGDIEDMLFNDRKKKALTGMERLIVAFQVASGIADVHRYGRIDGASAIAHTDISTGQFLFLNGRYKLNDFNRCRFLTKRRVPDPSFQNSTSKAVQPCGFYVGNNPGSFRSPEEYKYDEFLTEKIDVYSMGNVFYVILTELWPFGDLDTAKAQEKVSAGERPGAPMEIMNSTDKATQTLISAIQKCWVQDVAKRATADEIVAFLETALLDLGVKEAS